MTSQLLGGAECQAKLISPSAESDYKDEHSS